MQLERPTIQLIKHRNGRMNYEEVLRIGKGSKGGKSPLVEFHNVHMTDGTLRIALPWNPPKTARTESSVDSALRGGESQAGPHHRGQPGRPTPGDHPGGSRHPHVPTPHRHTRPASLLRSTSIRSPPG